MPEVYYSIIIPATHATDQLEQLFNTVSNHPLDKQYELILINDGNNSGLNKLIAKWRSTFDHFSSILIKHSRGAYHARNEGIKNARGTVIIFFDADVVPSQNWFETLKPCLEGHDYIAGNVKVVEKETEYISQKIYRLYGFPVATMFNNQNFGITAYLAVKKQVFNEIGLFEELVFSGGDLEFGNRTYNKGYRMTFCEDSVVWHPPKSLKSQLDTKLRILKGQKELAFLYPERFHSLNFRFTSIFKDLGYMGHQILHFKKAQIDQLSGINSFEYIIAQIIRYGIVILAKIMILISPKKRYNS